MNLLAQVDLDASATRVLSPASGEALELESLLRVIAEFTATDLGASRLLHQLPTNDTQELQRRRRRYTEAARLLAERQLVGAFAGPLAPLFERLETDRPAFDGAALLELAAVLRSTEEARKRITQADPEVPELGLLAGTTPPAAGGDPLADLGTLRRQIGKKLDRRGHVRDDASPRLVSLRGKIRQARDQIYRDLKKVVERQRDHLSEETIPLRGGRLVLLLSSGARGRFPGLVHGRSGTGQSFYFEPLGVVEANNTLQESSEEEAAERARILQELIAEARRLMAQIEEQARFLAELDALQAITSFAQIAGARLADPAPAGELHLLAARHPLLDPKLAPCRQRALGEAGHEAAIEPLELTLGSNLEPEKRLLVVTGPNAGGKTVSLKTLGLLAAAHQCGFPIPVDAGSRLPTFDRIIATIGDEQDLLSDRSTFSGRLLRLDEVWREARRDSLILLDELGSGTDPEEGAALAIALLEGLLERRCLGLLTTHLTPLAAAALELPGAACAAMEFDPTTGAPTYRLMPGPPGGSEALALARRLGLPGEWLDRAEAKLGSEHRDLRRLLSEVDALRRDLQRSHTELSREVQDAATLRARLAEQEEALREERRSVAQRLSKELESFRRETREALRAQVEQLTKAFKAGRRKGLAAEAEKKLFASAPQWTDAEPVMEDLPLEVGALARHRQFGWEGILDKLANGKAEVRVRGKKLRCRAEELVGVASAGKKISRPSASTRQARAPRADYTSSGTRQGSSDLGLEEAVTAEINLIGQRVEPALDQLDNYLDRALLGPHAALRVVHGFGTGRLRKAVRSHLHSHPAVAEWRPGAANEGGDGATVVVLRGG